MSENNIPEPGADRPDEEMWAPGSGVPSPGGYETVEEVVEELEVAVTPPPPPPAPQATMPPPPPAAAPPASTPPAPVPPAPGVPRASVQPVPPAPHVPSPAAAQVPAAQAPVAVPAQPNAFVMALTNLWSTQMDIWRGNVVGATDRPNEVKAATGNAFVSWLLPLLASSLAVGLFLSSTSASAMSSVNTVMGGYMSGPTFGDWFKTFFIVSIVFFGFMMLRALAVLLAARASGSQASFNDSASALGVGQTLWWLPLVIATVLFLIVPELAVLFLVPVILAMPVMSEIATYVGLTRLGNHKRSPLVPYAWFSALASIIMMLIFYSYIRNAFLSQMPF